MDAEQGQRSAVVAWIFARGGSQGLPGKNLRVIGGRSLVAHAVHAGLTAPSVDRVFVSTDDPEIARAAEDAGAEVPFLRPPELATAEVAEWKAWQHAVRWLDEHDARPELFVALPPTAPLRSVEDIERCIRAARTTDADIVLTVTPAARNPYVNMVRLDDAGFATIAVHPPETLHRRQDAPPMFDITPVAYVTTPTHVLSAEHALDGRVGAVQVPRERSIDIDDELDLRIASCLMGTPPA